MAKGNLLLLGGIATVAALALNKNSGSNRSANIGSTLKDTLDLTDAASLAKIISGSPDLQAYLKKIAGSNVTPPTVQDIVTNINNSYTLEGVQYQDFGGSVVPNGALERGDSAGWIGTFEIGDKKDNLKSLLLTGGSCLSPDFFLDSNSLYKLSFFYKNSALNYYNVAVLAYDENGAYLATASYNTSQPLQVQANWTKMERFIGGSGTTGSYLNPNANKFKVALGDANSNVSINRLLLEKVSIGEPVPSNLTYLPTGQEVYDSTTGDRGRYNGTTIDWYTMV